MASVKLDNVRKVYPNGHVAVAGATFEARDAELLVLVGPSGCGKSTTLRMIAGLEEASGGEIFIGGLLVNDVPPKDRDIAMVFQNYALYPHMTVFQNMSFGLRLKRVPTQPLRGGDGGAHALDLDLERGRKDLLGALVLGAPLRHGQRVGRGKLRQVRAHDVDATVGHVGPPCRRA